jgi:hypothetical protein
MRAQYPFLGCAVTTAIPIRCLGPIIEKKLVTGRVPTVLFVAKHLARGEDYVDA